MLSAEILCNLKKIVVTFDTNKFIGKNINSSLFLCFENNVLFISSNSTNALLSCTETTFDIKYSLKFPMQVTYSGIQNNQLCFKFKSEYNVNVDDSLKNVKSCLLKCSQCKQDLTKELECLELPHSYWQELVDCWSCHQQEFACNRMELLPRKDNMLIGEQVWVLEENIAKCNCFKFNTEKFIKLELDQIIFCSELRDFSHSFQSNVCMQLINMVEAHASYRFLIFSDHKPLIKLWIVNWQVVILDSNNETPIMKIMYGIDKFDEWLQDNTVEHLIWTEDKVRKFIFNIEEHSNRFDDEFYSSYLHR